MNRMSYFALGGLNNTTVGSHVVNMMQNSSRQYNTRFVTKYSGEGGILKCILRCMELFKSKSQTNQKHVVHYSPHSEPSNLELAHSGREELFPSLLPRIFKAEILGI